MTNDLEKQFFSTFGIEPKLKTFAIKRDEQGELTYPPIYEYPQITDRILLELICIVYKAKNSLNSEIDIFELNVNELKKTVLTRLIWINNTYKNKNIKHQVRTLFEEG